MSEQALIVSLSLDDADFGSDEARTHLAELQQEIRDVLRDDEVGELDGDELGAGVATLYLYGPSAEALFASVESSLRRSPLKPARAVLRHGGADDPLAREQSIDL